MAAHDSGTPNVNLGNESDPACQRLIKELFDLYGQELGRKAGQHAQPDSPRESRKRQVDETREDFKVLLIKAYKYLPGHLEMGKRFVIAAEIARQMCNKLDDGEEVANKYIWLRARFSWSYYLDD